MPGLARLVVAFCFAISTVFSVALPVVVQANSLTIATSFGPTAEIPDPRAGYDGWLSNQSGVTETLMGIDYSMNLYPRVASGVEQASPTQWRVTLRDDIKFHDGTAVTAQSVVDLSLIHI